MTWTQIVQFTFHSWPGCPPFLPWFNAPARSTQRRVGWVFDQLLQSGWPQTQIKSLGSKSLVFDPPLDPDLHLIVAILGFLKAQMLSGVITCSRHPIPSSRPADKAWPDICWWVVSGFSFFKQISQHWRHFKVQTVALVTMVLSLLSVYKYVLHQRLKLWFHNHSCCSIIA